MQFIPNKDLQDADDALRKILGFVMEDAGSLSHKTAELVAGWNPYDQTISAPFFDSFWMFGVEQFDVVIGNPPYVRAENQKQSERELLQNSGQYETLYEKWDLLIPFIEKGLKLLINGGVLNYIVSNALTTSKYADKIQKWIIENYFVRQIDFFENIKIFNQSVVPVIISVIADNKGQVTLKVYHKDKIGNVETVKVVNKGSELQVQIFRETYSKRFGKQRVKTVKLGDICYISKGMVMNADEKKAKGQFSRDDLISDTKDKIHTRPYIEGKDLNAYQIERVRYIESNTYRVRTHLSRPTFRELYIGEKIMRGRATLGTIDDTGLVCNDSIFVMKRFCDLSGVENKSITGSLAKNNKKKTRKQLEKLSEGYDLRFLLGIINSRYAQAYLNNFRRSAIKKLYYPDDFRNFPIPAVSLVEQKPLIALVKKRLDATSQKAVKLDERIDALVYELYGLTDEEIKLVEGK